MIEQIEWVPVAERLPDNWAVVLIFTPAHGGKVFSGYRVHSEWREAVALPVHCEVTHWAPIASRSA